MPDRRHRAKRQIRHLARAAAAAEYNETNPFALKIDRPGKKTSYILVHQPKSFDWQARDAKPHPLKQVPEGVFALACKALNQIIDIGD
ncbi:MAG TPA: hypothetical protein VIY49_33970 [Bryobacteraceae bacterium]